MKLLSKIARFLPATPLALAFALGIDWSARAQLATNCAFPPPALQMANPISLTPLVGSPNSFLKAVIANAPPGYAVTNGTYNGWSIDYHGSLEFGKIYQPILYYSYGDLTATLQSPFWSEINYLLNHPRGNAIDIQNAIWYFIGGPVPDTDPNGYYPPSAAAVNMVADAVNNGSAFVPGPGQVSAVAVDFGSAFQTSLIEVTCPTTPQNLASVGNRVWEDLNHDGLQEGGEPGVAGVQVQLYTAAGARAGTTVTDANGAYLFDQIEPGDYFIRFLAPPGYYYTLPDQGSDDTQDSDADGSGSTPVFTLVTRQHDATRDAGLFRTAALGDFVWYDLNKNGLQDRNEPKVGNVVVILEDCFGNPIVSTTTDKSGFYFFFNLLPGNYQLHFVPGPPFSFTTRNAGTNDALDSDADPITGLAPCVNLVSGHTNRTVTAGLVTMGDVGFDFTKVGDKTTVGPGGSVTYTYRVLNTGTIPLANVVITDDNATPSLPGDDFTVGTIPSLIPGAAMEFTHTSMIPVALCGGPGGGTDPGGMLVTTTLPDGNLQILFLQSSSVNDNSYGLNSIGWGPKKHKFSDLIDGDRVEFQLRNGAGQIVLQFREDYISPASSYASGFGTRGVSGGDGKMIAGSASSIVEVSTSMTENLNKPPFLSHLDYYLKHSPNPQSDPNAPLWEYRMIYKVVVDKATFGKSGFGGVEIVAQDNSPAKMAPAAPAPCSVCFTNIARLTAEVEGSVLSRTASAQVCVTNNAAPPGGRCPEKNAFYIKNGSAWPSRYAPSQALQSVFTKASLYPAAGPRSLLEGLQGQTNPGKIRELFMQAVGALLNSARPEISFSFTTDQVIALVDRALVDGKDSDVHKATETLKKANEKQKDCKSKSPPKPAAAVPAGSLTPVSQKPR